MSRVNFPISTSQILTLFPHFAHLLFISFKNYFKRTQTLRHFFPVNDLVCIFKKPVWASSEKRRPHSLDILLCNYWSFKTCCCCSSGTKSCITACNPVDCSPPGSSVHGISQTRILQWVARRGWQQSYGFNGLTLHIEIFHRAMLQGPREKVLNRRFRKKEWQIITIYVAKK